MHSFENGQRAAYASIRSLRSAILEYGAKLNVNVISKSAIFQNGEQRAIFE